MAHVLHINARKQRSEADRQNRSDALNRTLTDANRQIVQLKAELFATRVTAGFALLALGYALLHVLMERAV